MNSAGLSDVAMLTKTTTTNTEEIRDSLGAESELVDSSLLFSAAWVAGEAADGFLASRGVEDWITLFKALAELTRVQAEAGDPRPRFAMSKLLEKCAALDPDGRVYWLSEDDTARKKFTKAWDKLVETFPGMEANLRQRAEKRQIAARVFPDCQSDVLDKRGKLYGFRLIEMAFPERVQPQTISAPPQGLSSQIGAIEYVEEMEVYPIPWVRKPLRINVHGWRSLFVIVPVVLIMFACVFGIWIVLEYWMSDMGVRTIFRATLTVVIFGAIPAWPGWRLYRLLEDRCILAPALLQLASVYYHLLVIRKEGATNVIRMLRFTGTCPLCGGLVEIEKGRGDLSGRFVGKCGQNPLEHLFSFDHVLRRGRWLRS